MPEERLDHILFSLSPRYDLSCLPNSRMHLAIRVVFYFTLGSAPPKGLVANLPDLPMYIQILSTRDAARMIHPQGPHYRLAVKQGGEVGIDVSPHSAL